MKPAVVLTALGLVTAFAAGCSSDDDPAEKTGPVAASPLTGSIEGKTFAAKSAVARKGFEDGEKSIDIYDTAVTCEDFSPKAERRILISVPWTAGTQRDFKLSLGGADGQTATFVIERDSTTTDNVVSAQGRVEIIDAPTEKGATGKIRLRAVAQDNNVEGEIAVAVCD
jgi:hypothetical protein